MRKTMAAVCCLLAMQSVVHGQALPGTGAWTLEGDAAAAMTAGIGRYLDRTISEAKSAREAGPQGDRDAFARYIGAVDALAEPRLWTDGAPGAPQAIATFSHGTIYAATWDAFGAVHGEGLLVEPLGEAMGTVILAPDCDQSPEAMAGLDGGDGPALRLAGAGFRVIVVALIDRGTAHSGHPEVRMTAQPHREYIYRGAYQMGRHIIGYEVQKLRAAAAWAKAAHGGPVAVAGYGEGGLLALHAAAVDPVFDAALVSGYFAERDAVWREPIYRNVWRQLQAFGDAELAAMIAPRPVIVERAPGPNVKGPEPSSTEQRGTPGDIAPPAKESVDRAIAQARSYGATIEDFDAATPFSDASLAALARTMNADAAIRPAGGLRVLRDGPDGAARLKRQFDELMAHTQAVMHDSRYTRQAYWKDADAKSAETWVASTAPYRERYHDDVIGRLPEIALPPNARSRVYVETESYTGYEIHLDVFDDVLAYGILLVPKGITEGERRPVVVCQHGLEGRPQEIADPAIDSHYYRQYGCRLAEEGFVVYAPQNPYIGYDDFRVLQRKANPLGLSLFSFITRQHEQTLRWLKAQPFVDGERIAFYGLSYGGKTAMRVPALLSDYCLSICSGDFNEWIWKTVSDREPLSYQFTGEYEMYEFGMGATYNYAELSWLIFPRPFMVERGHLDGVAPDEWVAYEYARTRFRYVQLGMGDRTEIAYFNGPHTIDGTATFAFLRKHLNWPGN